MQKTLRPEASVQSGMSGQGAAQAVMSALVGLSGASGPDLSRMLDTVVRDLTQAAGGGIFLDLGPAGRFGVLTGPVRFGLSESNCDLMLDFEPDPDWTAALRAFLSGAVASAARMTAEGAAAPGGGVSTECLLAALEALPLGLTLYDAEDRLVLCNGRMRQIFPGLDDLYRPGTPYRDILAGHLSRCVASRGDGCDQAFVAEMIQSRTQPQFSRLIELSSGRLIQVIDRSIASGGRVCLRIDVTEEQEAARRLADVIEGSRAGTWEVDLLTGANVINDHWATMLGHTLAAVEPVTSETWAALIHPQDRPEVLANVRRMVEGEAGSYEDVYRMRHADGHWVWISDRGRISSWTADGRPSRMAGVHIDISAVKDAEQRLEDVISGAQAATWDSDLTTGRTYVNDRWAEIVGYRREDLEPITTETWEALIHPQDRERVIAAVDRVLSGEIVQYEETYRMRHSAGHWVWVSDRGRISRRTAEGQPARMSGVHFDVTAIRETERRLEEIVEAAEVATWQIDVESGINRINDRWAEMLGYRRDELEPMHVSAFKALIHPEDEKRLSDQHDIQLAGGKTRFQNEIRMRHRAGHWVWIMSRGRVTSRDEAGRPLTISGVHIDISARKKLEFDLQAERDFLSQVMETSASGILAVDADSRILFCNAEVTRQLELPAETIIGQICDPALLSIRDAEGCPMTLRDMPCQAALAAASGTVRDVRLRLDLADGRQKVFSVNAARTTGQSSRVRVVCTITDITDAAHAEDRLRAATERAEAANRAKSEFLANMSHELRTPLNGVMGMADLLADGTLSIEQQDMVRTIRESGDLLLSLVNDILDLAKVESGRLTLEPEPVDLAEFGRKILTLHGPTADRKGIALAVRVDPALSAPRLADPKRLLQILHNLVGNALKFTETGSVRVDILPRPRGWVGLIVTDTGIGMSPEEMGRVFEEFTQADGTITRRFGGTGLGLPIVRRLVMLMEGEVRLESTKGAGTTLTIDLPLPVADLPIPAGREAVPSRSANPPLRILVAEDNGTNQLILKSMLTRLGFAATLVGDGDEAVRAWAPGAFDVVLLDISMPRKDGVTALAELVRKAGDHSLPPVIAVTANAMTHHISDYRDAGFTDVLAKPLRIDALSQAILRAVASEEP